MNFMQKEYWNLITARYIEIQKNQNAEYKSGKGKDRKREWKDMEMFHIFIEGSNDPNDQISMKIKEKKRDII